MRGRTCTIGECDRPYKARGYCALHYQQYVFKPTHALYSIWLDIKQRCYNPKSTKYPYYGGSGIRVCEMWQESYHAFAADVGLRPSPRHALCRINPNKDYRPDNVQWSLPIQQIINRHTRTDNGTGITGVYYDKNFDRYHATITINGRRHHLGRYKTLPEAATARFLAEARYTV